MFIRRFHASAAPEGRKRIARGVSRKEAGRRILNPLPAAPEGRKSVAHGVSRGAAKAASPIPPSSF
jgi:hypothetical protein